MVGGLGGTIDPKTQQKYIWPMTHAFTELTAQMVNLFCLQHTPNADSLSIIGFRLFSRTERGAAVPTIASSASMARTSKSPSKVLP
jgi:hypothetical protein